MSSNEGLKTGIPEEAAQLPPLLRGVLPDNTPVRRDPKTGDLFITILPSEPMSPFQRVMEEVRMRELDRRDGYYVHPSAAGRLERDLARIKREDALGQQALTQALTESIEYSVKLIEARRKAKRVMARKRHGI